MITGFTSDYEDAIRRVVRDTVTDELNAMNLEMVEVHGSGFADVEYYLTITLFGIKRKVQIARRCFEDGEVSFVWNRTVKTEKEI